MAAAQCRRTFPKQARDAIITRPRGTVAAAPMRNWGAAASRAAGTIYSRAGCPSNGPQARLRTHPRQLWAQNVLAQQEAGRDVSANRHKGPARDLKDIAARSTTTRPPVLTARKLSGTSARSYRREALQAARGPRKLWTDLRASLLFRGERMPVNETETWREAERLPTRARPNQGNLDTPPT